MERPANCHTTKLKYVFRIKLDQYGNVDKYKTRLVAKGFQQIPAQEYCETYSPVVNKRSLRIFLTLAAHYDLDLHHLDVTTAFLYGAVDEDIYVEIPEGYHDFHDSDFLDKDIVLKLNKALYGLKQAPLKWNEKFTSFIIGLGYVQCQADPCVFFKYKSNSITIILLHVDDVPIATNDSRELRSLTTNLEANFKFKNLGTLEFCLGLQISRDRDKRLVYVKQSTYAANIIKEYWEDGPCKSTMIPMAPGTSLDCTSDSEAETNRPFRNVVGALMYLMTNSRPDLAYSVNAVARFMHKPGMQHWKAVKKILRYLSGTIHTGIALGGKLSLTGWADASFATANEDSHSILGMLFF